MCDWGSDCERWAEGSPAQVEGYGECSFGLAMYGGGPQGGSGSGGAGRSERRSFGGDEDRAGGSRQAFDGDDGKPLPTDHDASGPSRGTDFSVHRLLPPPPPPPSITFAPPPPLQLEQTPHHLTNGPTGSHSTSSVDASNCHLLQREGGRFQLEPLAPTPWVGYGNIYQQGPHLPVYSNNHHHPTGPNHRWVNQLYPQTYPMPSAYTNPPSSPFPPTTPNTPGHHHPEPPAAATVTSPADRSPQPSESHGNMHIYHPANAGLYTLCQAAMMSSSLPDGNPYPNYPSSEHPPPINLPPSQPRPPPPYIQYYPESSLFAVSESSHPPPAYHSMQMTPHQQQHAMICGGAEANHHRANSPSFLNTNGMVRDSEQPLSSPFPPPPAPPLDLTQSEGLERPGDLTNQQLPSGNGGIIGKSDNKPLDSIHNTLSLSLPSVQDPDQPDPSSSSSTSSSSLGHHYPPNIVQDGEQPGPSYIDREATPLPPHYVLPVDDPPHRTSQLLDDESSPFTESLLRDSEQSLAAYSAQTQSLAYRDHTQENQDEDKSELGIVLNKSDTEQSGVSYVEEPGALFVENAEEPGSGESPDDGIVATLASANAVIEGGDGEQEPERSNEHSASGADPNPSPTSQPPANPAFQLPPGLPPPPPPPPPASPPPQSHRRRAKRTRTAYSQAQQDALELAFHANPYPDGFFRQKVSRQVGIPEDRIQVWFQNRRARGKKQSRTGSVSQRSQVREERLKANLANIARQAALVAATTRSFSGAALAPSQNLPLQQQQSAQIQQQLHLSGQPQQQQPLELAQRLELAGQQQQLELAAQQQQQQQSLELATHQQQQSLELAAQQQQQSLELAAQQQQQPSELAGQHQQPLELPQQMDQPQSVPQQLQLQPHGMEHSHPDRQQGSQLQQQQQGPQQLLEQQPPELQQGGGGVIGGESEAPTSQSSPANPSRGPGINQLSISSPFSIQSTSPVENPLFPPHSDPINTQQQQQSTAVFSSQSSTICYFPQPTTAPPPQSSPNPNPAEPGASAALLPQSQPPSMAYLFPPSLGPRPHPQHPIPPIQHLYPPNPSFQFPHPSAPSRLLLPPPFYHHHQQQQQQHHLALVGGGVGSSASSPGGNVSPPVSLAGNRSHSAPSSVTGSERAGPQQEKPSP